MRRSVSCRSCGAPAGRIASRGCESMNGEVTGASACFCVETASAFMQVVSPSLDQQARARLQSICASLLLISVFQLTVPRMQSRRANVKLNPVVST